MRTVHSVWGLSMLGNEGWEQQRGGRGRKEEGLEPNADLLAGDNQDERKCNGRIIVLALFYMLGGIHGTFCRLVLRFR